VVGAHAFARGAPLGLGGHDRDGTVFQPRRPSGRGSPAGTRAAPRSACCSVVYVHGSGVWGNRY
jgi:hypothetical protein